MQNPHPIVKKKDKRSSTVFFYKNKLYKNNNAEIDTK